MESDLNINAKPFEPIVNKNEDDLFIENFLTANDWIFDYNFDTITNKQIKFDNGFIKKHKWLFE